MNKFAWLSASAMLALAMMGCATTPSNLPMVDVSKMPDKALTAAEIDSVVRGKQMVGNVTLANGYSVPRVIYVFEADGTLHGANPSDWDKGKWRVDQAKRRVSETLCVRHNMTTRSMSAKQTEDERCGAEGGASANPS